MISSPRALLSIAKRPLLQFSGVYIWTIKPPGMSSEDEWVSIYVGKASELKSRLKDYIKSQTFGPPHEWKKHLCMVDLMSRCFSFRIRYDL